jgi:hypothetical protein
LMRSTTSSALSSMSLAHMSSLPSPLFQLLFISARPVFTALFKLFFVLLSKLLVWSTQLPPCWQGHVTCLSCQYLEFVGCARSHLTQEAQQMGGT